MDSRIIEKIQQRRRQMLVHSYLYYEENVNIVSDDTWSRWAKELAQLQKDYPKESAEAEEYEQFKDWDGSSGAFLNFGENIKSVAKILLDSNKQVKSENKISKSVIKIQNSEKKSRKSKIKSTRSLF